MDTGKCPRHQQESCDELTRALLISKKKKSGENLLRHLTMGSMEAGGCFLANPCWHFNLKQTTNLQLPSCLVSEG